MKVVVITRQVLGLRPVPYKVLRIPEDSFIRSGNPKAAEENFLKLHTKELRAAFPEFESAEWYLDVLDLNEEKESW